MKLTITILLMTSTLSPAAMAIDTCQDLTEGKMVSDNCKAAAASGTVSAGGTYQAVKKFKQADSVEDKYSVTIREFKSPQKFDAEDARQIDGWATKGDQFTLDYELSEPESRKWWIEKYKEDIANAKSRAESYLSDMNSLVIELDKDGKLTTRSKTWSEKMMLQAQADSAFAEAEEAAKELKRVRNPKNPVELVQLQEQIESTGVDGNVEKFLKEEAAKNSKLIAARKLPVQYAKYARSLMWKGGLSATTAAVAAAATVYFIHQESERKRHERYYHPEAYRRYRESESLR
jgi:hypothetical protein